MKLLLFLSLFAALGSASAQATQFRDGDIIFQRSQSHQSEAIAAATHSEYTHVGIIFFDKNRPFVYEAIQPVTKTPLQEWIKRGKHASYVIKRLRNQNSIDFQKLKREVLRMLGKDYDWLFDWSDSRIYCSELVWKAYQRTGIELGELKQLKDFDLDSPIVK